MMFSLWTVFFLACSNGDVEPDVSVSPEPVDVVDPTNDPVDPVDPTEPVVDPADQLPEVAEQDGTLVSANTTPLLLINVLAECDEDGTAWVYSQYKGNPDEVVAMAYRAGALDHTTPFVLAPTGRILEPLQLSETLESCADVTWAVVASHEGESDDCIVRGPDAANVRGLVQLNDPGRPCR